MEEIDETPYWHLVPSSNTWALMFYNNVRVASGLLHSISYMIECDPNLASATSNYALTHAEDEKEKTFERVRQEQFPRKPSRLKTLYVFPSEALAQRAKMEWFPNESRNIHRAWIATGAKTHLGDAALLNCKPESWVANAHSYWAAEMSTSPFLEMLVHGSLYFPDWQGFPKAP